MKKRLTLKSMLAAAVLLVGTATAWAGQKTVIKYTFDDLNSPALTAGKNSHLDYSYGNIVYKGVPGQKFLNIWADNNSTGATIIPLETATDLSAEEWTLEFDWAGYGGCNGKAGATILYAGEEPLFTIYEPANWNKTMDLCVGAYVAEQVETSITITPCDKSTRISANTGISLNNTKFWHHFIVKGGVDGVTLTIQKYEWDQENEEDSEFVCEGLMLADENLVPTTLSIQPGSCGSMAVDELELSYYVEGEVIQTPIATITKVNGIERTISATCATAGATIMYSLDGETWNEGSEVTISETTNVYFKAVVGESESDVLTMENVEAGVEIQLNAPVIARPNATTVKITTDQSKLLCSPTDKIVYEFNGEQFEGESPVEITIEEGVSTTVVAWAEAAGYLNSENATREVELFPTDMIQKEKTNTITSNTSGFYYSNDTIYTDSHKYSALMIQEQQWGVNIYPQVKDASTPDANDCWLVRDNNWCVWANSGEAWMLVRNLKAGDIIVARLTAGAYNTVNATYCEKWTYDGYYAYTVDEDGDAELGFKRVSASVNNYIYSIAVYAENGTLVSITIPEDGYCTFVNQGVALDFAEAQGVRAYYAVDAVPADSEGETGAVVMEEITGAVAAGQAMFLQKVGEEPATVPGTIEGEPLDGNLLKVGGKIAGSHEKSGGGEWIHQYVFSNQNGLGFYNLPYNENYYRVPNTKAYLEFKTEYVKEEEPVEEEPAARKLTIVFNNATGIRDVQKDVLTIGGENLMFNLAGQRVNKAQKGLYIMNGKKHIVR